MPLQISTRDAHCTLTHDTEMVVLAQLGAQIGRIQCISVVVILATYKQSFVFAWPSAFDKQTVVGSYIQPIFVIQPYGSDGMLLLTVQVEGNLAQVEMLEIELITFRMSVERWIRDRSDHDTRWQLSGEPILVTYRIFCSTAFHGLCSSRHEFTVTSRSINSRDFVINPSSNAVRHLVLSQYTHLTDRQTDRQNCDSNTVRCITCRTVKSLAFCFQF